MNLSNHVGTEASLKTLAHVQSDFFGQIQRIRDQSRALVVEAIREASIQRSILHAQLQEVREKARAPAAAAIRTASLNRMKLHEQLQEVRHQCRKRSGFNS